ncbi:iron-containing alcohol dehydrogenase [uncultured Sphaerochaeta sp.]|uniref:iron-containing alcohol dehydrogenase n=1 Tax=uncultured Sphaerochaeta sp. TaxID=886478 RepID=UPI002A0A7C75|nr:iron-containing alcohol dehydrogenase [uncultured Sphaerochaeta sp.]
MISRLLSPVHILSVSSLQGTELERILRYTANLPGPLHVSIVTDDAPIEGKQVLIDELTALTPVEVFSQVQPNPRTEDIEAMFHDKRFMNTDIILGIGGGSVLDSAKALAMLMTNKGSLESYLQGELITNRSLPLVLIPTTAGTGSEVTKVGVYSDGTGRKHTLGSPHMSAHTAILIASLLDTVPPGLCAATGLDALDHALESIWNKNSTAITRECAREAAYKVLQTLPQLYDATIQNQERRSLQQEMLKASNEAGIAFNLTGTAAGHAISFILSENWHIPHGLSCAFTLLEVFDWAARNDQNREELAKLGKMVHPEQVGRDALVSALRDDIDSLLSHLKIPRSFRDLSLDIDRDTICREFSRVETDPKLHNQVPPLSMEDLYSLLEAKR